MKLEIKNLGIIDSGEIEIKENELNVKYGINGIGKSTISKGLEKKIKQEDLSILKKYGSEILPEINIDKCPSNIITFNQEYVNQFLFKEDLVHNSFEILINTEEYRLSVQRLNDYFQDVVNAIAIANIETISNDLNNFKNSLKFKKTRASSGNSYTVPGTTKFVKGKKLGDISTSISSDIKHYEHLLKANNNYEWIKWFDGGVKYITNNRCPFCLNELPSNFKDVYNSIKESFQSTALKQNVEIKNIVSNINKYINDSQQNTMKSIINSNEDLLPEEIEFLFQIYELCEKELNKLEALKNINVIYIKEMYQKNTLVDFLETNKLSIDFYSRLDPTIFENIKKINESIDKLILKNQDIKNVTKEFADSLNCRIKGKCDYVNDFLKISGIPYRVEIIAESEKNFKTVLKPLVADKLISKEDLSFGERNAISLILFSLEAERGFDLIILDDPVSSFDINKKYAILYYLFVKDNAAFCDKSIVLFTHDFNIIVDLMYKNDFKCFRKNCYFVSNENGVFSEKRIQQDRVKNTLRQWKKKAENCGVNILLRLVNLRKYLSYIKPEENIVFEILSSLEHLYPVPLKKENKEFHEMSVDEIDKGIEVIKEYISEFDYSKILKELSNEQNIIKWYKNAKSSIEKLQILREYLNIHPEKINDKVFMTFITESYHHENNEMMSLDESRYNIIPHYIMKISDEMIGDISS